MAKDNVIKVGESKKEASTDKPEVKVIEMGSATPKKKRTTTKTTKPKTTKTTRKKKTEEFVVDDKSVKEERVEEDINNVNFLVNKMKDQTNKINKSEVKELNKRTRSKITTQQTVISAGDDECYCYFSIKYITFPTSETKFDVGMIPLSIALINSEGDYLYIEISDPFEGLGLDEETKKNLLSIDIFEDNNVITDNIDKGHNRTIKCDIAEARARITMWLDEYYHDRAHVLQFVTDKNMYHFIILMSFITGNRTWDILPNWISKVVIDLNEELATSITLDNYDEETRKKMEKNFVPNFVAYDLNRNEIVSSIPVYDNSPFTSDGCVYKGENALKEAFITRCIHRHLWNLE